MEQAAPELLWPEQLTEAVLAEAAVSIVDDIRPSYAEEMAAAQGDTDVGAQPAAAGDARRIAAGDADGDGL